MLLPLRLLVAAALCAVAAATAAAPRASSPHTCPCTARNKPCPCGEWRVAWRTPAGQPWGAVAGRSRAEVEEKVRQIESFQAGYRQVMGASRDSHYLRPTAPACRGCTRRTASRPGKTWRAAAEEVRQWEPKLEAARAAAIRASVPAAAGAKRRQREHLLALEAATRQLFFLQSWLDFVEDQPGREAELEDPRSRFRLAVAKLDSAAVPSPAASIPSRREPRVNGRGTPAPSPRTPRTVTETARKLHQAAVLGDSTAVKALLDGGAEVDARDADGWTPLMTAVQEGRAAVAEMLIQRGADVNVRSDAGITPLMAACAGGAPARLIDSLLAKGADRAAKDEKGRTALDLAREAKRPDVVRLLQSARKR